jgi:WD40 repeat protein
MEKRNIKEKNKTIVKKHTYVIVLVICAVALSVPLFKNRDFVLLDNVVEPRNASASTLLQDGRVLITGGHTGYKKTDDFIAKDGTKYPTAKYTITASAEIFDPITRKFTRTGDMITRRDQHEAVLLQDGRVLIVGGYVPGKDMTRLVEIYDPKTGKFTKINSTNHSCLWHPMILLNDGKVFVFNAGHWTDNGRSVHQIFDPKTNTFSNTRPSLGINMFPAAAVLMDDGNIFMSCDTTDSVRKTSCINQIFNPNTGIYTATRKTRYRHRNGVVVKLANGDIGIFGGDICYSDNDCGVEIYSPSTGELKKGTHFPENKRIYDQGVVLLDDGKVLLVGGKEFIGDYDTGYEKRLKSAYLYDPIKDKFTRISDMHYERIDPELVKLKNGNVFITEHDEMYSAEDKPIKPELFIYKGGK